jgi:hypothetical protein
MLVLAAALVLPACGSPSPTGANVTGNWTGTITFTGAAPVPFTLSLSQTGSTVNGTFSVTLGGDLALGNVSGTTTADAFSGTFSIVQFSCGATVSGNAGGTQMTWTSAAGFNGICGGGAFSAVINKQ